jgi:outer membrane protein assembly factor BamD (BamD/ComL family)
MTVRIRQSSHLPAFIWIFAAFIGCGAALGQPTTYPAGERAMPPVHQRARLLFDPATDEWKLIDQPEPGTMDGDLDIVRQYIARQDFKEGLSLVKCWIKTYGVDSARYPEALYLKGVCELELGEYRDADADFKDFLDKFPGSEYAERALSARFRLAEQYLAGKKRKAFKGLFRVTDHTAGVKIMDDISANYVDTPLAELAQKSKADYFFARGDFDQAQDEYNSFAREHPRSQYHAYALLRSAEAALATFPGVQYDDAGLVEAQERYTQFLQQYPALGQRQNVPQIVEDIISHRADKTYEIGRHYEKYRRPSAAMYYYRETIKRYPGTAGAEEAKGRLNGLGEGETPAGSQPSVEIGGPVEVN